MEKSEFLKLYNDIIKNNSADTRIALEIIREYCIIKGKDEEMTNFFLYALSLNPHLIMLYFNDSIKQLCYNFQVIIVKDNRGITILAY